ncbi:MAG: hypothetical protein OEZ47_16500, partial [Gammaproteobacteria bacterium]|nr:hypothetical protein [Gammaproteobacteria bacterium]
MSEETRREFLRTTGQSLAATALAFALTDPRRASQVASAAEGGQVGIQQAPVRGASIVASGVLSHSGEFSSRISDLAIPGRGL